MSAARLLGDSVSLNLPCLAMPEARFEVQVLQNPMTVTVWTKWLCLRTSWHGCRTAREQGSGGNIACYAFAIEVALASVKLFLQLF